MQFPAACYNCSMSVAITADLHLTSRAEHSARFDALEDILEQLVETGVEVLVIAGDLFDRDRRDVSEFESIVRRPEYRGLHHVILPGNHDSGLTQSSFALANVLVMDQPRLVNLEEGALPFFFLPYKAGETAGAQLVPFRGQLPPDGWYLISHGDYTSGPTVPNPAEPGIYMPLTRADITVFKPARVFLGHTHLPFQSERVISPGSPSAVDSSETGPRGFWLVDPVNGWTAVLAASAVCFAVKLLGYVAPPRWLERPRVARVSALVTVALLAALVAVQTAAADRAVVVDARVPALAVAVLALLLRAPFVVVVVLAAVVAGLLRALGLAG